ncbi:uncharacterized protein LOC128954937 isoform X2 [Oppia nitens]|uniref:uncharacterized protein LOC128954937 isoform X2 n=1 Tax=Oppia nitens TaxID=1686743 RepID=UPI0023D995F3|nr:uncharacterized protein LOC128954937 isoform X2 [Oppia nitens]
MSDKNLLLTDTKTIINSLVVPHPNGIGLKHLCNEYYDLEGSEIPYRDLGYHSLTSFLKSMPDMIRLYGNLQDIHNVTIFPVVSEANKHVIDLVKGQNKTDKKRGRAKRIFSIGMWNRTANSVHNPYKYSTTTASVPPRFRGLSNSLDANRGNRVTTNLSTNIPRVNVNMVNTNSRPTLSSTASSMNPLTKKFENFSITRGPPPGLTRQQKSAPNLMNNIIGNQQRTSLLPTPQQSRPASSNGVIPPDIKEKIKIMMATPDLVDGIMLFNFAAQYRNQFKEQFDSQKFGFDTLAGCLQSVPELVKMIPVGTCTYKLLPNLDYINEMTIPSQETIPKVIASTTTTPTAAADNQLTNGHTKTTIITTVSTSTSTVLTSKASNLKSITRTINNTNYGKCNGVNNRAHKPTAFARFQGDDDDSESISSYGSLEDNNSRAIRYFHHLLISNPNGINSIDFPKLWEKEFDRVFRPKNWGFDCAMELFVSLPKVFAIEKTGNNDIILHDARYKKFETKTKANGYMDEKEALQRLQGIPDLIQAKIVNCISSEMPAGIRIDVFISVFDAKYEQLDLKALRFSDVDEFFAVLEKDLPIIVKRVDGLKFIYTKPLEQIKEWLGSCCRLNRYIIPITCKTDVPRYVVLPGEKFQPPVLPPKFQAGLNEYVASYISSAVSPHEMYIQFKGKNYHQALEILMHEMDFYEDPAQAPTREWSVPYEYLCVGLPCVAKYPGDQSWHRVKINKIFLNQTRTVQITFVDYGGSTITDYSDLRLMKREFLKLPIQGIKVALYGIKPAGGALGWTTKSRDKVLRFSKPTYALATSVIEYRNGVPMVAICDTNSDTDVFIHNVLIDDKHAVYEEDVLDTNIDLLK